MQPSSDASMQNSRHLSEATTGIFVVDVPHVLDKISSENSSQGVVVILTVTTLNRNINTFFILILTQNGNSSEASF